MKSAAVFGCLALLAGPSAAQTVRGARADADLADVRPRSVRDVDPGDLAAFNASLDGAAWVNGDSFYATTVDIDNGRVISSPAVVVDAQSSADVQRAMRFAQTEGLQFTPKSGGHSAEGYSLNDGGLVLNTQSLNTLSLDADARVLTVGAGVRWQSVFEYMADSGLVPVGGGCPTVGVSGFTLGGGFSFVSRSYGLGADQVLSATVVLPDGTLLTLTPADADGPNADLWWALRGGGGGNFFVLTELQLQVHEPPAGAMLAGDLCWDVGTAGANESMALYPSLAQSVPDATALYGWFGHQDGDVPRWCVTVVSNQDEAAGRADIAPLQALAPDTDDVAFQSLIDFELGNVNFTAVDGRDAYIKSGIIPAEGMTPEVFDIMQGALLSAPSLNSSILWTHTGGAIDQLAPDDTPYPWRQPAYVFEVKAIYETDDEADANRAWVQQLGEDMQPHFIGSYVNYIDSSLDDWQTAYYGGNYARLQQVKAKYDPEGFFHFAQGVELP